MAEDTQVTGPLSDAKAAEFISGILASEETPKKEEAPAPQQAQEEAPDTDDGVEDEPAEDVEAGSQDVDQAESDDSSEDDAAPEDDVTELPDTLEGFARELDMEPADLADHIKVRAKIDGKDVEVTLDEAVRGYQRQSDYSQKTAELARQAEAIQAKEAEVGKAMQDRLQSLDTHINLLQEAMEAGPSDEDLLRINYEQGASAYNEAKAKRDIMRQKLDTAKQAREKELLDAQVRMQNEFLQWRGKQQELAKGFMPELSKPAELEKFERGIRSTLKAYQYGPEEVENFMQRYDARQLPILRDAMAYRALQKDAPKVKKKLSELPKTRKPGAARGPKKSTGDVKMAALNRLRQSRGKGKKANDAAAHEYALGILSR